MFVTLKPLAERDAIGRSGGRPGCASKLANEPGANLFLVPVQDIRIGGRSNSAYQFTLQADRPGDLRTVGAAHPLAMSRCPSWST
jgi:multidrug efflux pump